MESNRLSGWLSSLSLVDIKPDSKARDKAVARRDIPSGSTVISAPAFVTALLDSEKGIRCDHCLREQQNLKKCSGCGSYWYCDPKCQSLHWQNNHKRLCKKIYQFVNSIAFQKLEKHEKMDSLLLTHLLAHLSTLEVPYSPELSKQQALFQSLLSGPPDISLPPYCSVNPPPPSDNFVTRLFSRFGNNNFTIHSHLNSIAHGIFPLASRLFNHSCVPNAACKYLLTPENTVAMEVVALQAISAGEEVFIPYIDPALTQTRQQVFQLTYQFTCECPSCLSLKRIGAIPEPPSDKAKLAQVGLQLLEFVNVEHYLKTGEFQQKSLDALSPSLHCVLHETFMGNLSESFSKSSHEGDYTQAADSGITLLALYLLIYPKNYPQIGMHLLEMAKTQWNHSFIRLTPLDEEKDTAKNIVLQLLTLSKSVLQVLGQEGDLDGGPFKEITMLEDLIRNT